jgi:hypothetical protein
MLNILKLEYKLNLIKKKKINKIIILIVKLLLSTKENALKLVKLKKETIKIHFIPRK